MNRLYEIFKTPSGPSTGKALLNHTIFSPSQTGETVPLNQCLCLNKGKTCYFRFLTSGQTKWKRFGPPGIVEKET
jgi:hypothetical protein